MNATTRAFVKDMRFGAFMVTGAAVVGAVFRLFNGISFAGFPIVGIIGAILTGSLCFAVALAMVRLRRLMR
jgi:hypothetical protein